MNNNCANGEDWITFEDLYRNYKTDIFLYAHHSMNLSEEEAHDVKNEAFLTLLKVWRDFKPKTYPSAVSFLRKTVQFLSYNLKRKEQHLSTVSFQEIKDEEARGTIMDSITYEDHIKQIKSELTPEEYQLFEDILIHRRDKKKLAAKMGISANALKVRWHRVRNKIKKILLGGNNGNK